MDRLTEVNNSRDITDIQAVELDNGEEFIIVGFIYAKRELVAYINTKTYVGEVYLEHDVTHTLTGSDRGVSEVDDRVIGYITVDDLVRYLEDFPCIEDYLTSNESGVVH